MPYADPEKQKESARKSMKRLRDNIKKKAILYKGGKCQKCGYSKCLAALEFHHRDPKKKSFAISKFFKSDWALLVAEIVKCDLLCANCHREEENLSLQVQVL